MSTGDLVPGDDPGPLTERQRELVETARGFIEANITDSTRDAYAADVAHFDRWCGLEGWVSLPADPVTIVLYISDLATADYAMTTIDRRLAAICWHHETNGETSATRHVKVKEAMRGIRRTRSRRPIKRDALTTGQIAEMVGTCDRTTNRGRRDIALLLVGYASACRRSELAAMTIEHVRRHGDEGFVIWLDRTKDEKDATKAREVGIPAVGGALCPVEALDVWLGMAEIAQGPLFRRVTRYDTVGNNALNPGSIAQILKALARAAGYSDHLVAGHSLRSGHATTAAKNSAPDRVIMAQTGHRSVKTLDGYVRAGRVLEDNSARFLNLETPTTSDPTVEP